MESELRRRNLSTSEINAYKRQCADDNEDDKLRRARRQVIPNLGLGKKVPWEDKPTSGPERLLRTVRIDSLVCCSLVFPFTLSLHTRCVVIWERWLGMVLASNEIALDRHPRNWEMILLTWVKASAFILAIRLLFLLLSHHPQWLRQLML